MNSQKELNFIKEATIGLFNRKGSSFEICVDGSKDNRKVNILLVSADSTVVGNAIRLELIYSTSSDKIIVVRENIAVPTHETLMKVDVADYVSNLMETDKEYSYQEENGDVDYYEILEELSEDIFDSNLDFELHAWSSEIFLFHEIGVGIDTDRTINPYHVHGCIGYIDHNNGQANSITTTIEMAESPIDGKTYVGLIRSVTSESKKVFEGNANNFKTMVIEQFKNAHNKYQY